MDNIPLALAILGVGLLNVILALVTFGAVALFWLQHHGKGLGLAWWILSLGLAAFAIAQTLEFRRLLNAPEQLGVSSLEITARFVFVCVMFLGLWRLFNEALRVKQRSLEQAETMLQLTQLQVETARRGHEIQLLHNVSQQLSSATELKAALDEFCRSTREALKAASVSVQLRRSTPDGFRFSASVEPSSNSNPAAPGPRLEGIFWKVIWAGKPQVMDPSPALPSGVGPQLPLATLAGFPLLHGETVIGVLAVGYETQHPLSADEQRLIAVLAGFVSLAVANAQLAEKAELTTRSDRLTGLVNRQHFTETLIAEARRAARYKTPLSLVLFGVNDLREYNDLYGYPAGDAYLKFFAKFVVKHSRSTDLVARLGDDRFAIIMPNTPPDGARHAALRFGDGLRDMVFAWESHQLKVCVNIGFAGWDAGEAAQAEALIAAADRALAADKALHTHP